MTLTTTMPSGAENRKEHRSLWTRQVDGELYLRAPGTGHLYDVSMRDISANGASMTVPEALAVSTPVSIVLKTREMSMEFMATVAWCSPIRAEETQNAGAYAVGVHIRGSGSFASMLKSCQVQGLAGHRH